MEKDDDDPNPDPLDNVNVVAEIDNDVLGSSMQAIVKEGQSLEAKASAKNSHGRQMCSLTLKT
jgi:hypothetical protein